MIFNDLKIPPRFGRTSQDVRIYVWNQAGFFGASAKTHWGQNWKFLAGLEDVSMFFFWIFQGRTKTVSFREFIVLFLDLPKKYQIDQVSLIKQQFGWTQIISDIGELGEFFPQQKKQTPGIDEVLRITTLQSSKWAVFQKNPGCMIDLLDL